MKSKIILASLALFAITSCKKSLDVLPETSLSTNIYFKTEAEFKQAVNGAYVPLRSITNDRAYLLGEMHSDNTYYFRNILFGATDQQENIADFSIPTSGGITTNVHVLNQYRLDYQIIARANQIISTIDAVDFDAASKANLKGQAFFLRAYAYFELVRYFGKVPLHLTPVTNRAEAALPLATVDELYAQIIKDATAAATSLLSKPKHTAPNEQSKNTTSEARIGETYFDMHTAWKNARMLCVDYATAGHSRCST